MLNALILTDGATENHSLPGICCRATQRVSADANRLSSNQHALGIEAVEDIPESLAFFSNPVFVRDEEVVDKHGIGINRVAAKLVNAANLHFRSVQIRVEQRHSRRRMGRILGRTARQQKDLVRHLPRRRPHLAPRDTVAAITPDRERLDTGGVQPGIGFGHTKASFLLAPDQGRQKASLLLLGAMHDDGMRSEQVDVDRRCRRLTPTASGHLLHHDRRFGDAEACAAKLLGHGDSQPAIPGHGLMKLDGEAAVGIAFGPILVVEVRADFAHAVLDCELVFTHREIQNSVSIIYLVLMRMVCLRTNSKQFRRAAASRDQSMASAVPVGASRMLAVETVPGSVRTI